MDLNKPIFHFKKSLHVCMPFLIFTSFLYHCQSLDSNLQACAPKSCGDGLSMEYPFWIHDEGEEFCGYPQFKITCNGNNSVLRVSNDEFFVKNVSYLNNTLLLASTALYDTNCPVPRRNYSIEGTPFTYDPNNLNLTFFYNCSSAPRHDIPTYKVNCETKDKLHSFAIFYKEALDIIGYPSDQCQQLVTVPASINRSSLLSMDYAEILKMGFLLDWNDLLDWNAPDCGQCERSGGHCGFDHNRFVCFCQDKPHQKSCDYRGNTIRKLILALSAAGLASLFTGIIVCCLRGKLAKATTCINCWRKRKNNRHIETFLENHGPLALERYKFSAVKKMTDGFKTKIGEGGYGSVYKGMLVTDTLVAVKLLNKSKSNGEDFINEVASISRTSHVNVVTLLGFCLEGNNKALIYEYLSGGSLDKLIYQKKPSDTGTVLLNWHQLHQIAIGIARGLEYLHRGCNTRILHFDIKPHNILLDERFCPKISDFGLSKIYPKRESTISTLEARGTIGYIAPEVFNRNFGRPSYKSDVYSYGMMVLEMVGTRRNLQLEVSDSSEMYFPDWIYEHLDLRADLGLGGVVTNEDYEIARKMIVVGLWCAQAIPSNRPSITKVIEMLEGNLESLQMPPKPSWSSPPRPTVESSTAPEVRESNLLEYRSSSHVGC